MQRDMSITRSDLNCDYLPSISLVRIVKLHPCKTEYQHCQKDNFRCVKVIRERVRKLSAQIRELLWEGHIVGIADHSKFQYRTFSEQGLPTGSGTVESAIRRVINLRIKGTGLFWKKDNAENMILLRSLVLTGKLRNACRVVSVKVKNMFYNNRLTDFQMAD